MNTYKISTIVDRSRRTGITVYGVNTYKISTIVDGYVIAFYLMRGVNTYKISTIVDYVDDYCFDLCKYT